MRALVAGFAKNISLKSKLGYSYKLPSPDQNANYYWPAVVNAAMKTIVSKLFASTSENNKSSILDLYNELNQNYSMQTNSTVLGNAEAYGEAVASTIFKWSKTDGGHEAYFNNTTPYTLPIFQGRGCQLHQVSKIYLFRLIGATTDLFWQIV